jgi:hypothetical protein
MSYRNYANTNGFIVAANGTGDFTTITDALTKITSAGLANSKLYLTDTFYAENFTLPNGCLITGLPSSEENPNTTISGKITFQSGTATITNVRLETNNDYCLVISGSSVVNLTLEGCFINAKSNDAINFTNTNADSIIYVNYFNTVIQPTYTLYRMSAPGRLAFSYGQLGTNGSLVSSESSNGSIFFRNVIANQGFLATGTALIYAFNSRFFTINLVIPFVTYSVNPLEITNCTIVSDDFTSIYIGSTGICILSLVSLDGNGSNSGNFIIDGELGGVLRLVGYSAQNILQGNSFQFNPILLPTAQSDVSYFGTLKLLTPLSYQYGGTGLSNPGTAGNLLVSTGSGWQSGSASVFPQMNDISTNTAASVNNGYNATAALTITLPLSPSQSDSIQIVCSHAGPIVVTANTGQTIKVGNATSSSAGTATNTAIGDVLTLRYLSASTTWRVVSSMGNWNLA